MIETLAKLQFALNLKVEQSFTFENFRFKTTTDEKIIVEKTILGTEWLEVIGTTTLKDLPNFLERTTDSPTLSKLGLLF